MAISCTSVSTSNVVPITVEVMQGYCDLGWYAIACSTRGLVAVALADEADQALHSLHSSLGKGAVISLQKQTPAAWFHAAADILHGATAPYPFVLDDHGTPFQRRVWHAVNMIPHGSVVTYTALAERCGGASHVRAVATAVGKNPCAVIIPCHRVLGSDGRLHGYRWGLSRKHALLVREGVYSL
jgi:O-6-methylguanine DNA methyltransferase